MGYRVELAHNHEHDLAKAAAFHEKLVEWGRQRAAATLALPADTPLDDEQRNRLRTLGVSLAQLGHTRRDDGNPDCVADYREAIDIYRRIGDKAVEAITEYNLGQAYKDVPAIRDVDASEAAYQRSLDLHDPNDALGRSKCINQIGMVHYDRFLDARERNEPVETLLRHAQTAEKYCLDGLQLRPQDALTDLGPAHNGLGNLYGDIGQQDKAREHYEHAAQYFERAGDHFHAGTVRTNMALMYSRASERENQPSQQRSSLLRARAYTEAALRDFQHYKGRAAKDEADAQGLLDNINQALAKLPQ